MWSMLKKAAEFINDHPRLILLMAWPVWTLFLGGLTLIIWLGPWLETTAMQMKQLDILAGIALMIGSILGLNQLAQSSSFFGRMALKVGKVFDLEADMDDDQKEKKKEEE